MPTIVRKASKPYKWTIGHIPLAEVANKEKKVPREYITADGFGITAPCRRYLQPLIAGEAYPPYKDGLPDYVQIRGAPGPEKSKDRLQALALPGQTLENTFSLARPTSRFIAFFSSCYSARRASRLDDRSPDRPGPTTNSNSFLM